MVNNVEVPLKRKQILKSGDIFSICERNFRFDYYDQYRPDEDEDSTTILQTLEQARTPPASNKNTPPSSKTKSNNNTPNTPSSNNNKGRRSPRFSTTIDPNITTTNLNQSMIKDQTVILNNNQQINKINNTSSSPSVPIVRTPKAIRPTTPGRPIVAPTMTATAPSTLLALSMNKTPSAPKSTVKASPSAATTTKNEEIPTPIRNSIQTLRTAATPKTGTKKSPTSSTPVESVSNNIVASSASKRRSPSPLPTLPTTRSSPNTTPPPAVITTSTVTTTTPSSSRKNTPTNVPMARGSPLLLVTAPTPLRAKPLTTVKDHHHRTPAKSVLKKSVIKMVQDENNMNIDENATVNSIVPSFPSLAAVNNSPSLASNINNTDTHRTLPTPLKNLIHKKRKSITFGHSQAALIPPKEDNRHFLVDDDNHNSDMESNRKDAMDEDDETTKNTKLNSTITRSKSPSPSKNTKVVSPVNNNAIVTSMNTTNNIFSMGIAPTNRSALLASINKRRKSYGSSMPPGKTLPPPEDTHLTTTATSKETSSAGPSKLALPSPLRRQITSRKAGSPKTDIAEILTKVNEKSKQLQSIPSTTTTTITSSKSAPSKPVVSLGNELAKLYKHVVRKLNQRKIREVVPVIQLHLLRKQVHPLPKKNQNP